jgi:hypothetical protein
MAAARDRETLIGAGGEGDLFSSESIPSTDRSFSCACSPKLENADTPTPSFLCFLKISFHHMKS